MVIVVTDELDQCIKSNDKKNGAWIADSKVDGDKLVLKILDTKNAFSKISDQKIKKEWFSENLQGFICDLLINPKKVNFGFGG